MEIKNGIYLRRNTPCKVTVGKFYVKIQYTKWNMIKEIWEFVFAERIEKRIFAILNKEPARSLFFYAEKWDYGEKKTGLINGKDIPEVQYRLRKMLEDKTKKEVDLTPIKKRKGKYDYWR